MGIFCQLKCFLSSLDHSDFVEIFGVMVNSLLAYWIVRTIQTNLTNKRVLKDHFINEIKDIRNEYKNCLNNLYSNRTHPKLVIPWFKLMNIRVGDTMNLINNKYNIETTKLNPYQITLQELVTNNEDFMNQFKNDSPVEFSENSKIQLIKFQQENSQLFNEIIIAVNDAK
jgi:hypothetical protein